MRDFRSLRYAAAALLATGGAANASMEFETSVDPGGCLVEHVAVEVGTNQYQYDSLSPDGGILAVAWDRGEEARGTYLLDLKTGERTDLPPAFNNGAVFSPDEKTLVSHAYVENGKTDILEYDRATGEFSVIAPHEEWEWLASYSSDGDFILFNSYRTGASDIYTYRRSDGAMKRWTDFDGYDAYAQFSPDDSKILFHRHEGEGDYNIYVIDVSTGEIEQLTSDKTEESYGSWSPDGETVVFASDRSREAGVADLFLMNKDGENVRRLTDMPAKDALPFFSPDGAYLYFNSDREPQGLYRMKLNADYECVRG